MFKDIALYVFPIKREYRHSSRNASGELIGAARRRIDTTLPRPPSRHIDYYFTPLRDENRRREPYHQHLQRELHQHGTSVLNLAQLLCMV